MVFANLKAAPGLPGKPGHAVMLTVTAPGAEHVFDRQTGEVLREGLPWDTAHCAARGEHRHSGVEGCRVDRLKATQWNLTADARWSTIHRRAATEVRRVYGNSALVLLCRAKEIQKRGLIHWHPVLLCSTPRQRRAVEAYHARLRELAPSYGFGFVGPLPKPQAASGAAAYLSSYFVTGKKGKRTLQESVTHPALAKGRLIWVSPRLTMKTGVTMRELRFRRFVWVRYGHMIALGGHWIDIGRKLAEVERDRGAPLTGDEVARLVVHLGGGAGGPQALGVPGAPAG